MRSSPSSSSERSLVAASGREKIGPAPNWPTGWLRCEVDLGALRRNLALFRELVRPPARLMAIVKGNGYGHGLLLAARAFCAGGADLLGVHSIAEARDLRAGGVETPVLVLGPLQVAEVQEAAALGTEVTVASTAAAAAVVAAARQGAASRVHLKVETGVFRQGIMVEELAAIVALFKEAPGTELVGLSSHFADIEDTTDHSFARQQNARFEQFVSALGRHGFTDLACHMSCSAATILWPDSHRDLARVGIAGYGIWPSGETLVSARAAGQDQLRLRTALTWKCRVAQIKVLPSDQTVGYGRTWKAPVDSRIAVLPVGYADGYPRGLSNRAEVLIRGRRAPLRGRVCMNLCMVDVTHIPAASPGDEVVMLGRQGEEEIRAEQLAEIMGTIPYEVLTWPGPTWPRVGV